MSLSAINHKRLDSLHEITGNYNKATLLDKLMFWWQHSTYTLNDNQKWFTRSVSRISQDSGIAKRSVERYMSQFEEMGLIEKRCVLLRKKNLYIRITEKLLTIINPPSLDKETRDATKKVIKTKIGSNLERNGGNYDTNLAASYIRSKDPIIKNNSTVSQSRIVNNSDELIENPNNSEQTTQKDSGGYKIEKVIGERITDRFKNYVKGVMKNLQTQYNLQFSNPEKLFAEIIFSVTNTDNQFQGIDNTHHRMNIIAKLLREKRWKTPKGFYNHWDVGQVYKEREDVKQRQHEALKQEEGANAMSIAEDNTFTFSKLKTKTEVYNQALSQKQHRHDIRELEVEIITQQKYLSQLEQWVDEGRAGISQAIVDDCALSIARIYERLTLLKGEHENNLAA